MATRYYVGSKAGAATRSVFKSATLPTPKDFPQFASVVGPFRTKRAAILCAVTYPNPHIQSVSDAERVAKATRQQPPREPSVSPDHPTPRSAERIGHEEKK